MRRVLDFARLPWTSEAVSHIKAPVAGKDRAPIDPKIAAACDELMSRLDEARSTREQPEHLFVVGSSDRRGP
jgi:hypothetical protein